MSFSWVIMASCLLCQMSVVTHGTLASKKNLHRTAAARTSPQSVQPSTVATKKLVLNFGMCGGWKCMSTSSTKGTYFI